ncbi:pathogenesis-related thaumatin-like protein 3.4 [Cryptomeria japonica]|uniref:pathogenesis-related thaumatin-like protein 3.4 n=1 Tax=Cryptomeria japonica TaxID=3369 RepID=UPI0025AD46F6|nr:pathogenesis-related thaumatin-like protein 3.4 [Cryptomeria japonica]
MARAILWILLTTMAVSLYAGVEGVSFDIENQCPFTVWAAGTPFGGGRELRRGQSWRVNVPGGAKGRLWGRTGCSFDGRGRGRCNTGDCGGLLNCQGSGGVPSTLFEYALNQFQNLDFYDISLVDGFNLRMTVILSNSKCKRIACNSDINSKCPRELKVVDGCRSACATFNTPADCCTGSFLDNCPPTGYSKFFKRECPMAYSYAKDDPKSTFTCPGGSNYRIVFCGNGDSQSNSTSTSSGSLYAVE